MRSAQMPLRRARRQLAARSTQKTLKLTTNQDKLTLSDPSLPKKETCELKLSGTEFIFTTRNVTSEIHAMACCVGRGPTHIPQDHDDGPITRPLHESAINLPVMLCISDGKCQGLNITRTSEQDHKDPRSEKRGRKNHCQPRK